MWVGTDVVRIGCKIVWDSNDNITSYMNYLNNFQFISANRTQSP